MQISYSKQTVVESIDINSIAKEEGSSKRNHSILISFLFYKKSKILINIFLLKCWLCYGKNKVYIL